MKKTLIINGEPTEVTVTGKTFEEIENYGNNEVVRIKVYKYGIPFSKDLTEEQNNFFETHKHIIISEIEENLDFWNDPHETPCYGVQGITE